MTDPRDDLAADLDQVEAFVPRIPGTFSELRALIARLPAPTPPDIHQARSGAAPDSGLTVSSFGQAASPLSGNAIGSDSGSSIGSLADLFGLQANNINDPTFETIIGSTPLAVGPGWTLLGPKWRARYTLNSGVAPANIVVNQTQRRTDLVYSIHSSAINLAIIGALTVCNLTIDLESVASFSPTASLFSNLVAAARFALAFPVNAGGGSHSFQVHVVNATTGNPVASSGVIDAESLGLGDFRRIAIALSDTPANLSATPWKFRISYTIAKTNAASDSIGIIVAEPQLTTAPTQQPPPFTPLITGWEPRQTWPSRTMRSSTLEAGTNAVPAIAAHRGYSNCAPENTLAAFRTAISYGYTIIETDVCWSQDGIPLISHDTTLARMSGFAAGFDTYDLAELRMFDVGSAYSSDFSTEGYPSVYDVLNELGGKATFIFEIKIGLNGEAHALSANRLARIIASYGLERHSVIASFSDLSASSGGETWSTYGIPTLRYTGAINADGSIGATSPAAFLAAGVQYVGIQQGIANFGAGASAWGAAGGRVLAWTIDTRRDRDVALAASASVTIILTSDPVLTTKPNIPDITVGQNIPCNARLIPAAMIPFYQSGGVRASDIPCAAGSSGQLAWSSPPQQIGWPALAATSEHHILVCPRLGWGGTGLGKFSVTMTLTAPSGDLTRFGGIGVATDDRGHTNGAGADTSTGYFGLLRQNGTIELFKVDAAGVETQIGIDATGAALVAGDVRTMTLEVTATNVIFIANAKTLNIADATYRALTAPYLLRSRAGLLFDSILRVS